MVRRPSRAMICDLVVWVVPLLLAGPLRGWLEIGTAGFNENDSERSVVLGWIVGLSMLGYAVGCWLKRPGLQQRVELGDSAGCLLVAWVPLMMSLCILGAAIVFVELDVSSESGLGIVALLLVAAAPVLLGARAMMAGGPPRLGAWRSRPVVEIVADVVLVAAILPAALVWQDSISNLMLQNIEQAGWGERLFAAVLTTGSFALFYFAPRLVLVIDRLRDRGAWLTFGLAGVPVLWRCLFP